MKIIKSRYFQESLKEILKTIAKDKKSAAIDFVKNINQKIEDITEFPMMCRASIYFDKDTIRDLIYKGYVIPYEIDEAQNIITILGITKYKKNL
jgi:plasmid stabilization system protein ParE